MTTGQEKEAVRAFFQEYVFNCIRADIEREIILAQTGFGGGNFLAALGLLCYTEIMGAFLRQNTDPELTCGPEIGARDSGQGRKNFDAFFVTLKGQRGPEYADLLNGRVRVYDIFRCGMAHEYETKKPCNFAMLDGGVPCGVGRKDDGQFYFVVERYFKDFYAACWRLYDQLMAMPNPMMPRRGTGKPTLTCSAHP